MATAKRSPAPATMGADEERRLERQRELRARINAMEAREDDNVLFWQRRIITVAGVANTAGVLALGTAFIQADDMALVGRLVLPPVTYFATGALLAGAAIVVEAFAAVISHVRMMIAVAKLNEDFSAHLALIDRVTRRADVTLGFVRGFMPFGATTAFGFGLMEAVGVMRGFVGAS